ncbi:MAG: hypothetical protein ACXVJD_11255 [Mucilaginibacter sp.]
MKKFCSSQKISWKVILLFIMLNIEIIKGNTGVSFDQIVVDGRVDHQSYYTDKSYRSANFYDVNVIEILENYSLAEIGKYFDRIRVTYGVEAWQDYLNIDINIISNKIFKVAPLIRVEFAVELDLWSEGFSLHEFSLAFRSYIESLDDKNIRYVVNDLETVTNGFGFAMDLDLDAIDEKLGSVLNRPLEIATESVKSVKQHLTSTQDNDTITSIFDFPESVKVPCHQYLMYFAQFLKDLGIDAKTEIKEQAASTLFTIIPNDKKEALDKIREALEVYINAPAFEGLNQQNMQNQGLAFTQFQANILHLKSQLMFSSSMLQMKDATIEALQLSNYQLKNRLETVKEKEEEESAIIQGIVSIKKYDGKWFSVNLPEIISRLKRTLK